MTSKIIQIAVTPATDERSEIITALCADGTIWQTWESSNGGWRKWVQVEAVE